MAGPYTYVTVSLTPGQSPDVNVSFHDSAMWVRACVVGGVRPYLTVSTDRANVSISTVGGGPVTDADVSSARQIFNAAATYLADCERLHAEQAAHRDQSDQDATTDQADQAGEAAA
jgi:hypothetical protein